jgi:hypothetical protein
MVSVGLKNKKYIMAMPLNTDNWSGKITSKDAPLNTDVWNGVSGKEKENLEYGYVPPKSDKSLYIVLILLIGGMYYFAKKGLN